MTEKRADAGHSTQVDSDTEEDGKDECMRNPHRVLASLISPHSAGLVPSDGDANKIVDDVRRSFLSVCTLLIDSRSSTLASSSPYPRAPISSLSLTLVTLDRCSVRLKILRASDYAHPHVHFQISSTIAATAYSFRGSGEETDIP